MAEEGRKDAARFLHQEGARPLPSAPASVETDRKTDAHLRIISAPIRLPDQEQPARYACCERGLALLLDALRAPSGGGVVLPWPKEERRDAKTGALILGRSGSSERSPGKAAEEQKREGRPKRRKA